MHCLQQAATQLQQLLALVRLEEQKAWGLRA